MAESLRVVAKRVGVGRGGMGRTCIRIAMATSMYMYLKV